MRLVYTLIFKNGFEPPKLLFVDYEVHSENYLLYSCFLMSLLCNSTSITATLSCKSQALKTMHIRLMNYLKERNSGNLERCRCK